MKNCSIINKDLTPKNDDYLTQNRVKRKSIIINWLTNQISIINKNGWSNVGRFSVWFGAACKDENIDREEAINALLKSIIKNSFLRMEAKDSNIKSLLLFVKVLFDYKNKN